MTYESKSFKEHHLTRLPVLERLLLLGWEREQIICPSPNSDDTEWHVPKTPSEATNRESKRSFKGYPVDIALFDDVEFVNDYEEINVLDLANFVLCAARLLSDDKPETVQVKTTLHSPGDVILQIWNFAQENAFPLLKCYMAIFGGKARDYEFHSIIGVIKGIINHKYDEDKKKIELRKLSAEADLAEQQALKQKLENIETMRRLQLSSVDAYAEPLATAAKNLAVQPSSATIIDITKILKSQQEDQPPQ